MQSSKCVGWLVLIVAGLISVATASAEDSTQVERVVPELRAYRVNPHTPTIDGHLDDEIWQAPGLQFARGFRQREPDEGSAETESTVVAFAYDDEAVYVAFWCYDSEPDKIQKQLVRRDRDSESDEVAVYLDPYHDHRTGNQFNINAAGVLKDIRVHNDDWTDDSWDAVWEGAAKVHPWGWAAEYKIPYHALRFPELSAHTWGVNFAREVTRKKEETWWSFTPQSVEGLTSQYGHLTGLERISPSRHLEILPYAVSKAELSDKTRGNIDGRSYPRNVGVDIKFGVTSNLTLDAAINPDFGQVELDEPVLNLSAFETWFDEKRPFFIEGSDIYQTPFTLFYSRRIGGSPNGRVEDPLFDYSLDRPAATSILGAGKLTGKLASGTSIAVLNAITEEEEESFKTKDGETRAEVVEPTGNYSLVRVKQDVLGNSFVGGIFTLASQDRYHPEMTGGVDWRLYTKDKGWSFHGQTVFSRVDSKDIGFGMVGTIEKESGEHWRGSLGVNNKDPNLDIYRLGFTPRNDYRRIDGWVQYRTQNDWWIVRNSWNNLNFLTAWNYNGDDIERNANFNTWIELTNGWECGGGATIQAEKYSDVETRGNGLWEWPVHPTYSWWGEIDTDQRKKLSFVMNPGSGGDRGGSWWANYIGLKYRPQSNMEFETGVNYHRTFGGTRWLDNDDVDSNGTIDPVFADLDRDQISLDFTAGVMITRDLSWQISGQGLISNLDYRDHKRYIGGNEYMRDVNASRYEQRNGTFSALNTMMLVRWEYIPGSTVYFVWTRARSEMDDTAKRLKINDELDRFFSRGAENVWLVKMSYWWNI